MRSVGHEPPLLLERALQALEQAIESAREIAEFIARILHGKALVQIPGAYASRLLAHGHDGSEALARQKIAAQRWQSPA